MKSTPNWRAQLSSRHPFFLHQHVIKIFHSAFYNRLVSLRSCTFCFHELEWHNQGSFGRLGHFTPLPPPTPLPILDGKHAAAQMAPDAEGGRLEMSRTWRKRCSRQRNKGKMKQRDWESGREAAVSSLLRWWLHPHSSAPLKPSEAFAMCKPTSSLFIVQHLGSVARFFFFLSPLPWTLLTWLFPEAWKHNISQPATPTGTRAQRWKCKGYVLLDSCRQINLNMYFGHVFAPTASWGSWNDYVT